METFPAYRIMPDGTLQETTSDEIGKANYLVLHPDAITQLAKFPESLRYARLLGAQFLIPTTNAVTTPS